MRGHRWFAVVITQLVLLGWAQLGQAQEGTQGTAPATVTVAKAGPTPPGPYFFHTNFAFNVYTHLGAMGDGQGPRAAQDFTPASRAVIYQQLGFGYFFHKNLRVQLTFQVGETVSGLPAGKDTVALFGIIPWLVFSHRGFVAGTGPIFAPISANTVPRFDAGIFFATGYTFKLPRNFSLGALVQVATFFADRTTVAVSPAITAGYRM